MIRIKRAYEPARSDDGVRILVERLWPRGVSREQARIDRWLKDLAPSSALRKWFAHDESKWDEFRRRYAQELDRCPEATAELRKLARQEMVTLVYAARDERHNNAVALKAYLGRRPTAR
jgi:uncharacterized protein YeaO (DUF488 family)